MRKIKFQSSSSMKMNLIKFISFLIVWLCLNQFNLISCAYKKRKNEHCSLQVNGICYDDELNDKPIKIVHDEKGMKSVIETDKKKNRKKLSNDILEPKISWDQQYLQHFKPKFKLFGYHSSSAAKAAASAKLLLKQPQHPIYQTTTPTAILKNSSINRSQLDQPKLIVKYHKLNNDNNINQITNLPKSIQLETSTILPSNLVNQYQSLNLPTSINLIRPTINPVLAKFKTINRPLLASSSFINSSPFLSNYNTGVTKFNYPLISPLVNSLTLKLPDNYNDNSLYTDKSIIDDSFESFKLKSPSTTKIPMKIVSHYLPKELNKNSLKNLSFNKLSTTTTTTTIPSNQWTSTNNYLINLSTTDSLTEPLPTNLTNYINLRESGKLNSLNNLQINENSTQDRIWSASSDEDDTNTIFPSKHQSTNELTTELTNNNLFSTEDQSLTSKEIDNFKLANQFKQNEFETMQQDNYLDKYNGFNDNQQPKDENNNFLSLVKNSNNEKKQDNSLESVDSKEFLNKKFKSVEPLNNNNLKEQHAEWPSSLDSNHHHIDELLANSKEQNDLKSSINYLTEDEQKSTNQLINNFNNDNNYPVFYPTKNQQHNLLNNDHKPTYTIIQTKDKNEEGWKRYAKLIKKIAIEFKKNELDTFLKRKKLIIDRYKPNDLYQKTLAAKFVWKKLSLDLISLLGYQIANYLGPINSKHWKNYYNPNLVPSEYDIKNNDQLKALEHILKNQYPYYQTPNKYVLDNQQFNDEFNQQSNQFLNDETFFNQNYFKFNKDHEDALNTNKLNDDSVLKNSEFENVFLNKDKELNQEFFQHQLINNKLLNEQLINSNLIDFKTKENLIEKLIIEPTKMAEIEQQAQENH